MKVYIPTSYKPRRKNVREGWKEEGNKNASFYEMGEFCYTWSCG